MSTRGGLVLELFPGISMLGMGFELEGFCVVRGPDLLWGGDIRSFNPPHGRFDGIIGGPPCQRFSRLANLVRHVHGEEALAPDMIPEFERVVGEAKPAWFVMENVPAAPEPAVPGYSVCSGLLDNGWIDRGDGIGHDQRRVRRWSFGSTSGRELRFEGDLATMRSSNELPSVTAAGSTWVPVRIGGSGKPKKTSASRLGRVEGRHTRSYLEMAQLAQGLPEEFEIAPPFTVKAAIRAVGNGVPIPMARAVARAVRRAAGWGPSDD